MSNLLQFSLKAKLILWFMVVAITAQAQFKLFKGVDEVEISIGPSLVSLYGENIISDLRQPKIGYGVRVGLFYNLKEELSLSANLLYQRKGIKTRYNTSYYDPSIDSTNCQCTTSLGTVENDANLDYLISEIRIRFFIGTTNFFVESGAFLSYLLKAQAVRKDLWNNSTYYSDIKNSFNSIDAGITLSLGYQIKIKEDINLVILIMDNYGLMNVNNSTTIQGRSNTNVFSFQIGLNYKL